MNRIGQKAWASSAVPFRPKGVGRVTRSPESSDCERLEKGGGNVRQKNHHEGRGGPSIQILVPISRVPERGSTTVFCFVGGGGGRYVTTLAFFCGGSFGVVGLKLSGSLNFRLFTSGAFDLPFPLALRVGGFRVDHSESGEGGS